ncbi:MAG: permease [Planctomycetota bacterium]
MKKQILIFLGLLASFLIAYDVDFADPKLQRAVFEGFSMLQWYARNHTLACVVPAMFIAGAIGTFFTPAAVLRHLGPTAHKAKAYSVASTSGTVLAVCSCSVLPMFAGIYRVGAGLGPAAAFLYSGPAINVMAIFLTARVLGADLGIARVLGSVVFAVAIGVLMAAIFRKDETVRRAAAMQQPAPMHASRKSWQTALFFVAMILFLVFSDWASPSLTTIRKTDESVMQAAVLRETTSALRIQLEQPSGTIPKGAKLDLDKSEIASMERATPEGYEWAEWVYSRRWYFAVLCLLATTFMAVKWVTRDEMREWMAQTWGFSKTIIPLLFGGVLVTGFVGALIPEEHVAGLVGGDSFLANLFAASIGALWYFATLTEIPILETLLGLGMGKGPALSLLLAGPALSLPSLMVIHSVIGLRKTVTFAALTVGMSALAGMAFGWFFP